MKDTYGSARAYFIGSFVALACGGCLYKHWYGWAAYWGLTSLHFMVLAAIREEK